MDEAKTDFTDLIDVKKLREYANQQKHLLNLDLQEENFTKCAVIAKNVLKVIENFHKKIQLTKNQQIDYNLLQSEWKLLDILVQLRKGSLKFSNTLIIKEITSNMLLNKHQEFIQYQFFETFLKNKQYESARVFLLCFLNCGANMRKNYAAKLAASKSKPIPKEVEIYFNFMQNRHRKKEIEFIMAKIQNYVINSTRQTCLEEDRSRQMDKKNASILQQLLTKEQKSLDPFNIETVQNVKIIFKKFNENMAFLKANQEAIAKILTEPRTYSYMYPNLFVDELYIHVYYYLALMFEVLGLMAPPQETFYIVTSFTRSMVLLTYFIRHNYISNNYFMIAYEKLDATFSHNVEFFSTYISSQISSDFEKAAHFILNAVSLRIYLGQFYVEEIYKSNQVSRKSTIILNVMTDILKCVFTFFESEKSKLYATHCAKIIKHTPKITKEFCKRTKDSGNWKKLSISKLTELLLDQMEEKIKEMDTLAVIAVRNFSTKLFKDGNPLDQWPSEEAFDKIFTMKKDEGLLVTSQENKALAEKFVEIEKLVGKGDLGVK